jgi:hypothetical protein
MYLDKYREITLLVQQLSFGCCARWSVNVCRRRPTSKNEDRLKVISSDVIYNCFFLPWVMLFMQAA